MNQSLFRRYLSVLATIIVLCGCENPVPDDYIEEFVVEGFVIAGQPLTNVRVYRTLPLQDTFFMRNATIPDAEVIITENGTPVPVVFEQDTNGGFFRAQDTSYRCAFNATYSIEVRISTNVLTATATTFPAFTWTRPPVDTFVYPGRNNETTPNDSLSISWQPTPGMDLYIIGVECLDTIGYGAYVTPANADTNRRIREEDLFDQGSRIATERTRFGFALTNGSPVVWLAYKWYGKHRLTVYAGDKAFRDWYRLVGGGRRSSFDYRLSNVRGGIGVFAGATPLSINSFLKKEVEP
jgi:hypothetical protein